MRRSSPAKETTKQQHKQEPSATTPAHQASGRVDAKASRALSAHDDALLRAVYTYQFVTVEQVTRLLYRAGSLKYVRRRLRGLVDVGYLQRLRLPSVGIGNTSYLYTLARRGIGYLTAAGYSDFARFRPSEQREHSYLFLTHTLRVNDFLIAAQLLTRSNPDVILADMRHERQLRRTPIKVKTSSGETIGVVPDGWLDFHIRGQDRMSIVLELDRGTVEREAFKRKIRGLLAYADGPYQAFFGSQSLTVAFAVTAGARRMELLREWCEQVLTDVRQERPELFLFGVLPPDGELDPTALFLSAMWYLPFGPVPISLLDVQPA